MPSKRLFNGLAHNIAHHAQSSFSGIHPHVVEACRELGLQKLDVDLIGPQSWPPGLNALKTRRSWPPGVDLQPHLERAATNLQKKFREMTLKAELNIADLSSAQLSFYPVCGLDYHAAEVRSHVELKGGRSFSHTIPVDW